MTQVRASATSPRSARGGWTVAVATNGNDAVESAVTFLPDIIFTDSQADDMPGEEIVQLLGRLPQLAAGIFAGIALARAPNKTSTMRWEVSTLPAATAAGGKALSKEPGRLMTVMGW